MIATIDDRTLILKRKEQIADLLVDSWPNSNAWQGRQEAIEEVEDSLKQDKPRASIVAVDGDELIGWIAGAEFYAKVFEIHPLVVKHARQKSGVGRMLLRAFERKAKELGFSSVFAGSDDTDCSTSLGGVELYPNALEKLAKIRNRKGHPYEFYVRCGYELVGVLPDANGKGKPDIYLAKST